LLRSSAGQRVEVFVLAKPAKRALVDASHDAGLGGRYAAKLEGKAQDPLTHGRIGQDAIGNACRFVAHAPRAAARTKAALLAREGDENVVAAGIAMAPNEAS
jgi:hypothetical protein